MNASPPNPRVVRVSNYRDLKQVFGLALLLAPVWLFCAYHEVPRMGKVHAEEWFILATAGGFWILLPFLFVLPPLQLLTTGTWIADARGIEFIPLLPRLRRWRCMMWSEVERVKWLYQTATLQGGGEQLLVVWTHLSSPERESLKARVEASLAAADFDLWSPAPKKLSEQLSPWRVLKLAAVPVGSLLAFAAVTFRYPQLVPAALVVAFGWVIILYVLAFRLIARVHRDPKSGAGWRLRRTLDQPTGASAAAPAG